MKKEILKNTNSIYEDFIKAAINSNIKVLGFSDHAFFENVINHKNKSKQKELDEYISLIVSLREKYKKIIKIKLGFEIEYQENFYSYYRYLLEEKKFDFLILGQHMTYNSNNDDLVNIISYKNSLIKGIETGLFLYICHPDFFMKNVKKITPEIEKICSEICEISIKYDVPFEVDFDSLNEDSYFWKIVSKKSVKCVLGLDVDDPQKITNSLIEKSFKIAKEKNINLVKTITTINTNLKY